jgi:four helix bundle protein
MKNTNSKPMNSQRAQANPGDAAFGWYAAHQEALFGEIGVLEAEVHERSRTFPKREQRALAAQMRQAMRKASAQIREGLEHKVNGELAQHLDAGWVSLQELANQVYLATDLGYLTPEHKQSLEVLIASVSLRVAVLYQALFNRLPGFERRASRVVAVGLAHGSHLR